MIIQAQVIIPRDTGLPEDASINTFHFDTLGAANPAAAIASATARIENFYNDVPAGETFAVREALSVLNSNPVTIKFYDAEEYDLTGPLATAEFTLGAPGSSLLPEEVALSLSYKAAPVAGQPAARLRGRIFLGPLSPDIVTLTGGRVHVQPDVLAAITRSAKEFLMDSDVGVAPWVVFSRGKGTLGQGSTTPTATADWVPFASRITTVWADDAFDTIRSRGTAPLTRATRTAA